MNAAVSPALRSFEALWQARGAAAACLGNDPLAALRAEAMRRVRELGLPTTRDETWRYTNLRSLLAARFVDAPPGGAAQATVGPSIGGETAITVRLINGHPTLPDVPNGSGLELRALREMGEQDPGTLAGYLRPLSDADQSRWSLLNAALFVDGLYVRVAGSLDRPLVIEHVLSAPDPCTLACPRIIIEAAAGSRFTLIEHFVQRGSHAPLCNSASSLTVGEGASVEHYRVFAADDAAEHIDGLGIRLLRDSRCRQFNVALGGALLRSSLDAVLEEPGARLDSFALLVGHESRHVDCVNRVTHAARDTHSSQTARIIASGRSRAIFNSKVIVDHGAAHSESMQSCRGLLLSATAEIDTRPQLEIHTDEVRCAHGATTGRLDRDMLFYMLSRGLDRNTAQSLLVYAFLADVLTGVSQASLRSAVETALIAQLPDSQLLSEFR